MRSDPVSADRNPVSIAALRRNTETQDACQLHQLACLRGLPPAEIAALQRGAALERIGPGGLIFSPSASPRSLHVLATGLARRYRLSEAGAETGLGYVAPGEIFEELSAFSDLPRECFAEAVRPSSVWKIPLDAFRHALERNPSLAVPLARRMALRLRRLETRVEDLVHRPVRNRLARALTELARDLGSRHGEHVAIDVPITQSEIATLIGATRQTVNEALGELTRDGLLARDRRRLVLLAPERLAAAIDARSEPKSGEAPAAQGIGPR
jgi:CRP-like cAMP-binding protein